MLGGALMSGRTCPTTPAETLAVLAGMLHRLHPDNPNSWAEHLAFERQHPPERINRAIEVIERALEGAHPQDHDADYHLNGALILLIRLRNLTPENTPRPAHQPPPSNLCPSTRRSPAYRPPRRHGQWRRTR